ncbi:Beige protein-like 1 [Vermiconidia calcicola]|uniref:Beige protein-like 1 n=1 Tax=Vermiconidia calcicola TaxID=1690605 RepID=A0ACC3NPL9_9PEZI|nr:Beige protein-like 1 [Vermiconidia calcicola]
MALSTGQPRRHRSSTGASRGLNTDEKDSSTASLINKLSIGKAGASREDILRVTTAANDLKRELASDTFSKDVFRHGKGFEVLLELFQPDLATSGQDLTTYGEMLNSGVLTLCEALKDHRGNERYFSRYLNGWHALQTSLTGVQKSPLVVDDPSGRLRLFETVLRGLVAAAIGQDLHQNQDDDYEEARDGTENDTAYVTSGNEVLGNPEASAIAIRLSLSLIPTHKTETSDAQGMVLRLWRTFAAIVELTSRNRVALWQTGTLSDLLPHLLNDDKTDDVRACLDALCGSLIGLGLNSLDDVALLFKRACDSDHARELLLSTLRESKGPAFIQFDLSLCGYSSIELPSLPRAFPPTTGYTLTAWIRIQDFDPNCHTTLFGAFDSSQTCFILMYLEKDSHQLILQTSIRSSRPSVRFKSTRFAANRNYHVALVHKKTVNDPRHSSALLFVDGEFAEQVKCSYPEAPPEREERRTSTSPSPQTHAPARHLKPVQAFFGTPHDLGLKFGRNEVISRWSLAGAHLYSAPLSDEFVAVHHRLGPRYIGNLQDCLGPLLTYKASAELNRYNELLHPDKSDTSDIIRATENHGSDVMPETKLLISIAPTAIIFFDGKDTRHEALKHELDRKALSRYQQLGQQSRGIAINAAISTVNEAISRSYGTGMLAGDPVITAPKALDDASWCLTGSLPVLLRILDSATTKTAFLQSVEIFFECVKDNWRISEAMEKGNGFGILATVIREKLGFESGAPAATARKTTLMLSLENRQSLPIELLQIVLEFVGYDKVKPEDSMIVNPMAYRVLLVDFDTWRRCDSETQRLYYAQFVHFVSQNRHSAFNQKRLLRMRVVRKFIEALKSEEFQAEIVIPLMDALKALLHNSAAGQMYRDLAMFVAFGLQDERATATRTARSMASAVNIRQKAASWARTMRSSRPSTPSGGQTPQVGMNRAELAIHVLELLERIIADEANPSALRRFNKAVPNRWLLHLLAENDARVVEVTVRILCRSLAALGPEFKSPFVEKNGGFITLKSRLKTFWKSPIVWISCFAIMFGRTPPKSGLNQDFTVFAMVDLFSADDELQVVNPEMLPTIMAMLEAGLRHVVQQNEPPDAAADVMKTVIQFLHELYNRSVGFKDFAANSRYLQEILFVLYPVLVGSDRLSAETELQSEKDSLSFKGEEVKIRSHSNSLGERPPSVRSLNMESDKRLPSPRAPMRVEAPRRLSSFVLVSSDPRNTPTSPAQFNAVMAPKKADSVHINIANSVVESLLELATSLFIDLVCNKEKFNGIGLFLKVPPGFREHQAYFESYVLVHTLTQLWNYLLLNQSLLSDTRVLTNLSRYSQHMSEAVFEGWFIEGAQPVLEFTGKLLEYLQKPEVALLKGVRLCSQHTNTIRIVFLRVCLWRLAELDELTNQLDATRFLKQMDYWQTILFSSENHETQFIRLICFLLYMKLVSTVHAVRLAAARLWRTILVQKPTETATLLTFAMGSEQRHLSTGFMKLSSMDDDEFLPWVDENRSSLDEIFIQALNKSWDDFVNDENRRTEDSAKARLNKRRDKLRSWQTEETSADEFMHRYEISTSHWRSNVHAQERLKLQRSIQDHQENVNHLLTVFLGIEKLNKRPSGIDPDKHDPKWQLDETEAVNRMRMRLVQDTGEQTQAFQPKRRASERLPREKLAINTQVNRGISDNIVSSIPASPLPPGNSDGVSELPGRTRSRSDSVSNSQLLEGGFEMVDDPREADDGIIEDKNRKVMTSLQRGDVVQQLYNISRIVGLEACEGLLVLGKKCLYMQDNFFQRSDGEIVSVSQAPDDERDPYVQLISGKDVGAQRTKHSIGEQDARHWTWAEVLSLSKRRFLFRDVSIEVFFTDGRSYLITCTSSKIRDELYNAVVTRAPHVHSSSAIASEDAWRLDTLRNPEEGPQSLGSKFASVFNAMPSHAATRKWIKGEMSNFQYLMLVNTMAGRSFNDLTQYPVFPWVLADYTSDELDLDNPKSFRDFSKPMGCQTDAREQEYRERYKQFAEMGDHNAPPFHYGTHYSSAMIVSSYLIRLQPFVQSYLLLQGGSFDHADRLFDSIEKAWLAASKDNMTDVRELTPEFFYLPEFLKNINKYDFGVKQAAGEAVNDVKLPPWAKGDPYVFVTKHREALESPFVSERLHQWVDLVFGYKQRGEAAVEATNVFQHLSYQGSKDLDSIDDPVERLASIGIIHSFGQTPHQVFQKPHPARERERGSVLRLDTSAESLLKLPDALFESDQKIAALTFSPTQERLLCAGPSKLNMLPNCDRFMQWAFADNSIRFFSANTKRLLGLYENTHVGQVSVATFTDSKTLVTAGTDCTIGIWGVSVSRENGREHIDIQPKTYLFGHRTAVVTLAASRVFSTLLSASSDGHILIWGLNRYQCIRVLHPMGAPTIQAARISNVSGHILICQDAYVLVYTLNGHLLLKQKVCESPHDRMTCCAFYEGAGNEWLERELIFTGHTHGVVNVWALTTLADGAWYLQLIKRMNHTDSSREGGSNSSAGISAILPMAQAVYTGDEEGRVWEWDCVQRQSSIGSRGR